APPDARAHLGGGATYRVAGALSAAFLELGALRVVFDYVFLRAAHFRYFLDALPEMPVQVITLWASLETVVARERARSGRPRLGLALRDCYQEMSLNPAQMGRIVDTDAITPEATAQRVHELLANAARL
ncbi:MAG TPA: hypothetical protein VNW92_10715, partial [Polyangiaceae bacterium]|nr:hypothetical protein [Polyangiaceae bacterium]